MAVKLGGKKGEKYALGQNADINVTPFVDVMLVLLIIFMVSIPLATVAIKIDLPPATNENANDKPTYLSIGQDGAITLVIKGNNTKTTLATLGDDVSRALGGADPRSQNVLIRADRTVRYKDFMAVVNQLQTDGYYKVALITENQAAATT
jgi:biopolymer transport protein ExbD